MKFFYPIILFFAVFGPLSGQVDPGTVEWIYLENGATIGSCTSPTDCDNSVVCYGVQYTPTVDAGMTSYTFTYSGNCGASGIDVTTNSSCVLIDNSFVTDLCAGSGLFQIGTSASGGGTVPVTANTPIIIHQICFDLSASGDVQVDPDAFSPEPYTVSLNLNSGGFATDFPTFSGYLASVNDCSNVVTCDDAPLCSVDFSSNGPAVFPLNGSGNINDGANLANTAAVTTSLDLYDEASEDCSQAGGLDDVTVTTELINTFDVNGNGLIDERGGSGHQINQEANGLTGVIPFNRNTQNESSAGDVRGYRIRVDFADHIGIRANQLTVNLSGMNSVATAFESASLQFLNNAREPYSPADYQGYFNGTNDLSGNCAATPPAALPWTAAGAGTIIFDDADAVNTSTACNPGTGSTGTPQSLSVAAVANTGLDPNDVVRGFILTVYGEDVAAPVTRDDGSGLNGDDGITANAASLTDAELISGLLGYEVVGCVFEQIPLPVTWLDFTARKRGEGSQLDWSTAAELGHDRFTVEWSTDGRSYQTVGSVRAPNGESATGERYYDFYHDAPASGLNYYRIRQHDLDGRTSLSVIRLVEFSDSGGQLAVFPNPAGAVLNLRLPASAPHDRHGALVDAAGRVISRFRVPAGVNVQQLSLHRIPPGLYVVRLETTAIRFIKE